MGLLEKRVLKLEKALQPKHEVHLIWVCEGQSLEQARAAYLRPILPGDKVHYLAFELPHPVANEDLQEAG